MRKFSLSPDADKNKIFLLDRGELEGRFDPLYYTENLARLLKHCPFEIKTFKEAILYAKSGFASGKADQADENGIIQIRPTNMDEHGLLKFDKNIYVPLDLLETKETLQKNEILFNNTNSQELVGKTAYFDLDGDYFCSNHITRIACNNSVYPKYLWVLLNLYQRHKVFFNTCTNWNNQSGVNVELLKSYKIPFPPKDTQKTIINIMDAAYETKKTKEVEAKELLESIDAYLLDELGIILPSEPINNLDERVFEVNFEEIFGGRFDPDYNSPKYYERHDGIQNGTYQPFSLLEIANSIFQGVGRELTDNPKYTLLKVKNILQYNEIDYEDVEFIHNVPEQKLLKQGDIITPFIGEAIKQFKFAIFDNEEKKFTVDNNTGVIRINNKNINNAFVCDVLNSVIVRWQIEQQIGGGGVPFIGTSGAKHIRIPLPEDIHIQNSITKEIKAKRDKAKKLKIEAKELFDQAKKEVEKIILGEIK